MSVRREERRDPVTGAVQKYWIVDANFQHPDGKSERVRKVLPVQNQRGAEHYERELRTARRHVWERGAASGTDRRAVPATLHRGLVQS